MGTFLTSDFVERRIHALKVLPEGWNAARNTTLYQLDLKMCQIKTLIFSFEWGKEVVPPARLASLIDFPSRILKLDLSLNELVTLAHDGLTPFRNLRELDASLNKLTNFQGIEVLHHLYSLNLAHNALRLIDPLINQASLVELNLSMNDIRDISSMPSLINLRILNLSGNNLESLEGLSSLPKLEELNVQRNQLRDIVPITSCLKLQMLNAAENRIMDLSGVYQVLEKMKWLQVLSLYGNPIDREPNYQSEILQTSHVMTLDNISVRPMPRPGAENRRHSDNIITLKDAARQAFEERMRGSRAVMEQNVNFLQGRILALQSEYREFEQKMRADLNVCLRYLDTLSSTSASQIDPRTMDFLSPRPDFLSPRERPLDLVMRGPVPEYRRRTDYSGIKDTDEVLKCAYNELARGGDTSRLDQV